MLLLLFFTGSICYGQNSSLTILPEDIRIEQSLEGGYHLWIRQKPGMESILITESVEEKDEDESTYALRNTEYHPVNGDERRKLNGEFLNTSLSRFPLIDSTPENTDFFAMAFHIFIPYVVEFGYSWTRNGKYQILDGSFISIRAFSRKYADYSGGFIDNAFVLKVVQAPVYVKKEVPPEVENSKAESPVDPSIYMSDTIKEFSDLSNNTSGEIIFGKGEGDVIENLRKIFDNMDGDTLDLVLALDTTQSMENDIPYLQSELIPLLLEYKDKFIVIRIGMILYRDYFEEYITKVIPFQLTLQDVQTQLDKIRVLGGRDIPEAVYEALYEGIHEFEWQNEERAIVLIGDAPPHPLPRGNISKEMVIADSETSGIKIHTIILPQ